MRSEEGGALAGEMGTKSLSRWREKSASDYTLTFRKKLTREDQCRRLSFQDTLQPVGVL